MRDMRFALLLALLVGTPASAADQFDLVCTAKKTTMHYRVDLAAAEFCSGECTQVQKIAAVSSGLLTLEKREPAFRGDVRLLDQVNRATGEWTKFIDYGRAATTSTLITGNCSPASFSGFPAKAF